MTAWTRVLALCALVCACNLGSTPAAQLKESVEEYVRSIRWGHIERAANYVPEALRAQFIRQKRLAQAQVTIHEYDIRAVEYVQGAKQARVIIAAVWSRPADPVTHQQLLAQDGRLGARGWEMSRQHEVQQLPAHLDVVNPGDAL